MTTDRRTHIRVIDQNVQLAGSSVAEVDCFSFRNSNVARKVLSKKVCKGRCSLVSTNAGVLKATLNKPSKISAQTWMTQFFGLLYLSRGPFGQFAGR